MILILSTLLLLINFIPQINSKEHEFSSILYDFNGTCEGNYYCLPFANISYSHIWEDVKQEEIIKELNKEVKKCPGIKRNVVFKESRIKFNEIGIFAENDIDFNTTIGSFTPKNSITSDMDLSAFEGKDYYEQYKQFPSLNLSKDSVGNTFRIIFNLLFHAYHFEDSNLQLMFKAWPSKPNVPLFTLSIYEWKLLKPDRAFKEISQSRQNIMRRYYHFIYLLNETWTEEQRSIIFNGRDEVSIDDFIYAYFIYLTRSATIQLSKEELFTSIAPFVNHMQKYRDDLQSSRKQTIYFKNESQRVRYNANDFFEADDELYIDVRNSDNFYFFIVFGYFYSHNPYDCFVLDFIGEEDANATNLKQSECVNAKHIALERYYLTCNMFNMEEKDQVACQRKIKKLKKDDGEKIRTMFEKCAHPKWSKWNIFETPRKELELILMSYQKYLEKTKEYMYLRIKDQKNTEIARQIYEYLSIKTQVAGDLMLKLDELEEIQVKLPKLNKKAKKQYKKKVSQEKKQERKKLKKQELEEKILEEMKEKGEYAMEDIEDFEEQSNYNGQEQQNFEEQIHSEL